MSRYSYVEIAIAIKELLVKTILLDKGSGTAT